MLAKVEVPHHARLVTVVRLSDASLKRARNRDVHGYVANRRREDFPAVEPIFVPAFNILIEAMSRNQHFDH